MFGSILASKIFPISQHPGDHGCSGTLRGAAVPTERAQRGLSLGAHPLFWAPFTLFGEVARNRAAPSQKLGAVPKN